MRCPVCGVGLRDKSCGVTLDATSGIAHCFRRGDLGWHYQVHGSRGDDAGVAPAAGDRRTRRASNALAGTAS